MDYNRSCFSPAVSNKLHLSTSPAQRGVSSQEQQHLELDQIDVNTITLVSDEGKHGPFGSKSANYEPTSHTSDDLAKNNGFSMKADSKEVIWQQAVSDTHHVENA